MIQRTNLLSPSVELEMTSKDWEFEKTLPVMRDYTTDGRE